MLEKLMKIQQELKAPKGQYNNFGNYSYRSCEDILEAVKPLLLREKLVLKLSDELVQIGERYYIKATAKLIDENGEIENIAYAREEESKKGMDGSQITGASSSYARKYALNGLFLIDDVKDSDSTNDGSSGKRIEVTEEDANKYKFTFGKHKEETLIEVIEDDEDYIDWLVNNSKDEYLLKCIEILTGQVKPNEEELKERVELISQIKIIMQNKGILPNEISEHFGKTSNEMSDKELKEVIEWLVQK